VGIVGKFLRGLKSEKNLKTFSFEKVEKVLQYTFRDKDLLEHALTHRSILPETGRERSFANEQMEFLGDAVLDLVIVEHLCRRFPDDTEGELSKLKAMLVSGRTLQTIADKINLGQYILMSDNEARNGGRKRGSILEDTFEAIVAGIYLDGGLQEAKKFITAFVIPELDKIVSQNLDSNYKSQLLEYAQANSLQMPVYKVIKEAGPDHKKEFEIEVSIDGSVLGNGMGKNKKSAQQKAALSALKHLNLVEVESS